MSEAEPSSLSFVISAPSGAGKTTLATALLARVERLSRVITCTTRPPRVDERDRRDYFFLGQDEFDRRRDTGALLEWAEVHGHCYGTPKEELERIHAEGADAVLVIDVQGAEAVRRDLTDAISIFVLPPSREVLIRRLTWRDETDATSRAEIERRIQVAGHEISRYVGYDYLVVNDEIEVAVNELQAIVLAERCRRSRRHSDAERILGLFGGRIGTLNGPTF